MVLPAGCVPWDYEHHADYPSALWKSQTAVLTKIRDLEYTVKKHAINLRPLHHELFEFLTPSGQEYFAGNYRGCHKRCLRSYDVQIQGDPRVGVPANAVEKSMHLFAQAIFKTVEQLDLIFLQPGSAIDSSHRAIAVVRVACAMFVDFLTIHPFANGNGHVARSLLWIVLAKYGYEPSNWTIDPRPTFPQYSDLIIKHRSGERHLLENFVLSCLTSASKPTQKN